LTYLLYRKLTVSCQSAEDSIYFVISKEQLNKTQYEVSRLTLVTAWCTLNDGQIYSGNVAVVTACGTVLLE